MPVCADTVITINVIKKGTYQILQPAYFVWQEEREPKMYTPFNF